MSIRLEMLQVARLSQRLLGESADLIRAFLQGQFSAEGGALDRDGKPDLYYTIFALAGLQALDAPLPTDRLAGYLAGFGIGENLDFIHLGALARCWAVAGLERAPSDLPLRLLDRLETYRSQDGGYDSEPGRLHGNAYGCFVALGAYQDLGRRVPDTLRIVQSLKFLETPDGAWGNARGLRAGATPATAAAITLLHHLDMPINQSAADWLLGQLHPKGGFAAVPRAPIPDLLSTATALHALAILQTPVQPPVKERLLDFVDTLWSAEGGFHGHWADDVLDSEYTFYGLLALGHLAV